MLRASDLLASATMSIALVSPLWPATPAGIWLLVAAALDPRISKLWLDIMPYSFLAAMEKPITGICTTLFSLDFCCAGSAGAGESCRRGSRSIRTDPTNWMSPAAAPSGRLLYRIFEQNDDIFVSEPLREFRSGNPQPRRIIYNCPNNISWVCASLR